MTAPVAGTIALILAALIGLVIRVMSVSIMAGTVLACVLAVVIGCGIAWLKMPGKGAHAVQREFTAEDKDDIKWLADVRKAIVSRPPTKHEPPWQPAPVFEAAPVIEPAAITSGPPATAATAVTVTATLSVRYTPGSPADVDDRIRAGMGVPLLPPVAELLGYPSVDDALASMYRRADALELRARLEAES